MHNDAAHLSRRLASMAEAVCVHYLSNGHRQGRFWQVGDVSNSPGRSLFVRLVGPERGPGAAGKWTDAATGDHGDLLDLIALNRGLNTLRDVLAEARQFLSLPPPIPAKPLPVPRNSSAAAQRLFAASRSVPGTLAEVYLRSRGITCSLDLSALRFHPACYCRPDDRAPVVQWPAMIAAVTDLRGTITGVHRTWLATDGQSKAPLDEPRRALGDILGSAVRFGGVHDVLAAGEGIETMLALRSVLPSMPMVAASSAAHLAVIALQPGLRRLYIARDNDPAGCRAAERLIARAAKVGIDPCLLIPCGEDWNSHLIACGLDGTRADLITQLTPEDVARIAEAPSFSFAL